LKQTCLDYNIKVLRGKQVELGGNSLTKKQNGNQYPIGGKGRRDQKRLDKGAPKHVISHFPGKRRIETIRKPKNERWEKEGGLSQQWVTHQAPSREGKETFREGDQKSELCPHQKVTTTRGKPRGPNQNEWTWSHQSERKRLKGVGASRETT